MFGGTDYYLQDMCRGDVRDMWVVSPETAIKYKWDKCVFVSECKELMVI